MDWLTHFLTKLSQPLLHFVVGCFDLFIRLDHWWTHKTEYTKIYMRFILFTMLLMMFGVYREIQRNNDQISTDNRNTINYNLLLKENKELERWKIKRLEDEITTLKKLQQTALETERQLQTLKQKN